MNIWKFPLEVVDNQVIGIPEVATILSVQMQRGTACLWAICDPSKNAAPRTIEILGTGHPMPEGERKFIDTIQINGGSLIFHVFERSD